MSGARHRDPRGMGREDQKTKVKSDDEDGARSPAAMAGNPLVVAHSSAVHCWRSARSCGDGDGPDCPSGVYAGAIRGTVRQRGFENRPPLPGCLEVPVRQPGFGDDYSNSNAAAPAAYCHWRLYRGLPAARSIANVAVQDGKSNGVSITVDVSRPDLAAWLGQGVRESRVVRSSSRNVVRLAAD